MSDFEMPYFVDGGGNKGYFKDSTARDQISDLEDLTVLNSAIQNLDLNNISGKQSIIYTSANSTNKPTGATWGVVVTLNYDTNTACQLYLSVIDSKMFARSKNGGNWHPWITLSNAASSSVVGNRVDVASYTDYLNPYTTPHEGFVRFAGTNIDLRLYATDAMRSSSATDVRAMWLPKGVPISFSNTPSYAHWYNCSDE